MKIAFVSKNNMNSKRMWFFHKRILCYLHYTLSTLLLVHRIYWVDASTLFCKCTSDFRKKHKMNGLISLGVSKNKYLFEMKWPSFSVLNSSWFKIPFKWNVYKNNPNGILQSLSCCCVCRCLFVVWMLHGIWDLVMSSPRLYILLFACHYC